MRKIILVGNPNTGKSTLFNTLSKSSEHVGNWHGVTVDVKQKQIKLSNRDYLLCDLPGIYSLESYSEEEKIASDFISKNKEEVFICIVDANNLRRNLYLFFELKQRVKNIILAVNMANEVKNIDTTSLSKELNVPVIKIDARKKKSVASLKEIVEDVKSEAESVSNEVKSITSFSENGEFSINKFEEISGKIFSKIDNILENVNYKTNGFYGFSKIDKALLNPFWGFVIFALVMMAVFFLTFGRVGTFLSDALVGSFEVVISSIMKFLSGIINNDFLLRFIEEGIFGGALTVIGFMPQIVIMFMCLNILEDLGYLSRVAFMFDHLFKKFGLTGRSVFSLIMGFGCTTTAVVTTRNLDNESLKKRTAIMLPFMSCSAKLPIYAVICSAFFIKYKALIVFTLYLTGILLSLLVAFIMKKFTLKQSDECFLLEMPKFRLPSFVKTGKDAFISAKSFLVRVGGVLVLSSAVVFLLCNFSFGFKAVEIGNGQSIIEKLAGSLSYIFIPLGFGSVGAVVSILTGLIAKEMVVSTLAIINKTTAGMLALTLANPSSVVNFSPVSAISFLVFVLLYSPCLSAIISMRKEVGLKLTVKSIILQFSLAYFISALVYGLGVLIINSLWWIALIILIVVALVVFIVLKCMYKKLKSKNANIMITKSQCLNCKEKCYGDNKL